MFTISGITQRRSSMHVLSRNSLRNLGNQESAGCHGIVKKTLHSVKPFWNRYENSFKWKPECHMIPYLIFDFFQGKEYHDEYSKTRRWEWFFDKLWKRKFNGMVNFNILSQGLWGITWWENLDGLLRPFNDAKAHIYVLSNISQGDWKKIRWMDQMRRNWTRLANLGCPVPCVQVKKREKGRQILNTEK